MIQFVLILLTSQSAPRIDVPKLLGAPQATLERSLGKAFKPRQDPGYFFTPKGYDVIRVNGFGRDMNAVLVSFNELLSPSQALSKLGIDPKKAVSKSLAAPGNVQIQLVRSKAEIHIKGLPENPGNHKPWRFEYEQDAHGNSLRAKALKAQIQGATGKNKARLIQSCYDWRTKILIDGR